MNDVMFSSMRIVYEDRAKDKMGEIAGAAAHEPEGSSGHPRRLSGLPLIAPCGKSVVSGPIVKGSSRGAMTATLPLAHDLTQGLVREGAPAPKAVGPARPHSRFLGAATTSWANTEGVINRMSDDFGVLVKLFFRRIFEIPVAGTATSGVVESPPQTARVSPGLRWAESSILNVLTLGVWTC